MRLKVIHRLVTRAMLVNAALFGCTAACESIFVHSAAASIFGSGLNAFDIEFVTIGDPSNIADTTGDPNPAGSVPYLYQIGKFEISEQMIDKANAEGSLGITKDTRGPNKPATSVSWSEALMFVNWLNTSTGNSPAYKFDGSGNFQLWSSGNAGYDPNNLFRNSLAKYFLPSRDEWYKAAYYDPALGDYYDYPTGSDSIPDGIDFAGDTIFDAVINDDVNNLFDVQPHDVTDVGALSPYGTAGQGGNAAEFVESEYDGLNNSLVAARELRPAGWEQDAPGLLPTNRAGIAINSGDDHWGFRVASIAGSTAVVPELTSLAIWSVLGLVSAAASSRRR